MLLLWKWALASPACDGELYTFILRTLKKRPGQRSAPVLYARTVGMTAQPQTAVNSLGVPELPLAAPPPVPPGAGGPPEASAPLALLLRESHVPHAAHPPRKESPRGPQAAPPPRWINSADEGGDAGWRLRGWQRGSAGCLPPAGLPAWRGAAAGRRQAGGAGATSPAAAAAAGRGAGGGGGALPAPRLKTSLTSGKALAEHAAPSEGRLEAAGARLAPSPAAGPWVAVAAPAAGWVSPRSRAVRGAERAAASPSKSVSRLRAFAPTYRVFAFF